jgi:hypothetical protein
MPPQRRQCQPRQLRSSLPLHPISSGEKGRASPTRGCGRGREPLTPPPSVPALPPRPRMKNEEAEEEEQGPAGDMPGLALQERRQEKKERDARQPRRAKILLWPRGPISSRPASPPPQIPSPAIPRGRLLPSRPPRSASIAATRIPRRHAIPSTRPLSCRRSPPSPSAGSPGSTPLLLIASSLPVEEAAGELRPRRRPHLITPPGPSEPTPRCGLQSQP